MSFCRPLLLPVHTPKLLRKHLATCSLHAFNNAAVRNSAGRHPVGHPIRFLGGLHKGDNILHTTSPPTAYSSEHISERAMSAANTESDTDAWQLGATEYEEDRASDSNFPANLPSSSYLDVFHSAVESKDPKLAEAAVSDILERYEGENWVRCEMLHQILTGDLMLLKRETVLRMLQHLDDRSWPKLGSLLTRKDGGIARKMIRHPKVTDTDRPFLRLFYPPLLERIKTIPSPKQIKATTFKVPLLIYASFATIQKLLNMSFNEQALRIFQALTDTGYIPIEALHNVDNSSNDAMLLMSMVVIRSCLHWNFRALAASLMSDLITTDLTNKALIELNIDIIHTILNSEPTARDITSAGHLIRRIHLHSPVPDSVIRLFYNSAMAAEAKDEAEVLYAFTREKRVRDTHRYPPPHGVALPWLMDHLGSASSRTHLARTLATETVEDNLSIPVNFRAQFIAKTALLGYATQARALWERHVEGRDGAVVGGNSACMIRMVRLFWNLHKTNAAKARALRAEGKPGTEHKIEQCKKVSHDAAALVERVRLTFSFHHAPLREAPHWHLTSLARACFIVGKISEGYQIFRILFMRRESPDLYDCNVALSAIAELNPRLAVTMIERMTEVGLRPDKVSFSTALHHAVMQGEREVVELMIKQIRDLDIKRISTPTIANLIRASLIFETNGSQTTPKQTLDNILHLIRSFPHSLSSQASLAKDLVNAAIRAKDGVLAFKFWQLLMKKGAEWDDWEQQQLRHVIAQLIRRPSCPLKRRSRWMMLIQLAQRKVTWRAKIAPTRNRYFARGSGFR